MSFATVIFFHCRKPETKSGITVRGSSGKHYVSVGDRSGILAQAGVIPESGNPTQYKGRPLLE
jgi:hypothetical protein